MADYLGRRLGMMWFFVPAFLLLHTEFSAAAQQWIGAQPGEGMTFLGPYLLCCLGIFFVKPRYELSLRQFFLTFGVVYVFPLFTLLSVVWSVQPYFTLKQAIAIILSTTVAIRISYQVSLARYIRMWALMLFALNMLSLAMVFLMPDLGRHTLAEGGMWRGMMSHKNGLGKMASFSLILIPLLWRGWNRKHWLLIHGAVGVILLFGAQSATAISITFLFYVLYVVYYVLRRTFSVRSTLGLMTAGGAVMLVVVPVVAGVVLNLLGRDMTLSGRVQIWTFALLAGIRNPLLGVGYGAFWFRGGDARLEVIHFLNHQAAHTHNAFLDLWLDLGIIGVLAGVFVLREALLAYARCESTLANDRIHEAGIWITVWMLLGSFTETGIFNGRSYQWITMISLYAFLRGETVRHGLRMAQAIKPVAGGTRA